ncbi:putative thiamine transport system permease protein [Aeromonas sp. RU39B]|uniref:ABC transporter permease n=1 Tax=Aeromonas sp. RU39B TaxID=1907416 RepID=UPI000954E379|nr:ABC transporter permease [Aeromonas sp. RU39B]SIQ00532.1 putative thiamine transport system permease protein [Aeromonas sp. RU39B]
MTHLVRLLTLLGLGGPLLLGLGALLLGALPVSAPLVFGNGSYPDWQALLLAPGLLRAVLLTGWIALASTLLGFALLCALLAHGWGSAALTRLSGRLSPLLALPHVAFAVGLAFMLAPSGWLLRLPAQLFNWSQPPDWQTLRDPLGCGLIVVLLLKELPFLLLMALARLPEQAINRQLMVGRSLGFAPAQIWWRLLIPSLWPVMRLPLAAVAAYGCGVVDLPLLLGPDAPPVLAQQLWLWSQSADLTLHPLAHRGALLLLALTLLVLGILRALEWGYCHAMKRYWLDGIRRTARHYEWPAGFTRAITCIYLLVLTALLLWSLARRWPFPALLPQGVTARLWQESLASVWPLLAQTLLLAVLSATLALIWALLELESRRPMALWFICLPLLLPQASLLLGIELALARLNIEPGFSTVLAGHLLWVFPYVYLCLHGPWQGFDQRLLIAAQSLGASPWRSVVRIKLPLLIRPLMAAFAVGLAVSLAQYLPTLLLGGGRIITLTTEAVAIGSGLNRRLAGLYGLLQTLIPLLGFALALWLPGRVNPLERRTC